MTETILRAPDVERMTGLTERSVRIMESEGAFPRRFTLNPNGGRAVGWKLSEVQRWIEERASSREPITV